MSGFSILLALVGFAFLKSTNGVSALAILVAAFVYTGQKVNDKSVAALSAKGPKAAPGACLSFLVHLLIWVVIIGAAIYFMVETGMWTPGGGR